MYVRYRSFAGFGGQGVMFIGNLLAYAGMAEDHKVTYMPVYGVEMRGGTANCTVVVSDDDIGSPIIHSPRCAVVMNKPSLDKFGPRVQKDGLLVVNASLIKDSEVKVKGPDVMMVPATELAAEAGNDRLANMVILGALAGKTGLVSLKSLNQAMKDTLPERSHKMIPANSRGHGEGRGICPNGQVTQGAALSLGENSGYEKFLNHIDQVNDSASRGKHFLQGISAASCVGAAPQDPAAFGDRARKIREEKGSTLADVASRNGAVRIFSAGAKTIPAGKPCPGGGEIFNILFRMTTDSRYPSSSRHA